VPSSPPTVRSASDRAFEPETEFDWSLVNVFLVVARRGSIAAATDELGMSHPTARRQLERLEAVVGAPLFTRSSVGMSPTQLGVALLERAAAMERAARSFTDAATRGDLDGTVAISVSGFLVELLGAIIAEIRRDHAGLRYDLTSLGAGDLLRREADVSVTLERPLQESVVSSRPALIRFGLFASSELLQSVSGSQSVEEAVAKVGWVGSLADLRRMTELDGAVEGRLRAPRGLIAVDGASVRNLVTAGLGIGALPVALGVSDPGLVQVMPEQRWERELWLSYHPDLRMVPHVRLVLDAIRRGLPRLVGTPRPSD
jgi:DNA-binding transcriptional LysR family regulator